MVSSWLLALLLAVIAVQANNATIDDGVDSMLTAADNAVLEEANNASIALAENSTVVFKDAPCHPNQTEFAAMTEFTLEGRNDHMTVEEGLRIEREFIAVYNYLAAINCDSHFRRLALISKVNSTNSLGHVVFDYVPVRRQQQSLQTNNSTGAGLSVMYNVSGTCRVRDLQLLLCLCKLTQKC
ncbi:expressed unknown protein [Seminavis robusta]|uniref:Cystatin domain-containing protein n=1 Tax=Seminavis robusta TaxID=568900 RepID=A0A9N8EFW1_9STRA|nr:expressed unknown protein [Seminavis robusta]|eukprot:Sro875_g214390.1 n/a (183) ;mRNA; r:25293-25841